jgi:hypothetical protein
MCVDQQQLVTYLYGESTDAERAAIAQHLASCAACAAELEGLRSVRTELAAWKPPEHVMGFRLVQEPARVGRRFWQPAWALAAAATVVLGSAAVLAGVTVRQESGGWVIRIGGAPAENPAPAPGLADRVRAIEEQFAASRLAPAAPVETPAAGAATPASRSADEAALLRRVEALIRASEDRQQRELALRLSQAMRDVDRQRQSDLIRIQRGLGELEGFAGREAVRTREALDYLMRVSQRPPP